MKVELDRVISTKVEMEIPLSCPKCGEDFHGDPDDERAPTLLEMQLSSTDQECAILAGENDADGDTVYRVDNYGDGDQIDTGTYVTGYQCGNCRWILATTEDYCTHPWHIHGPETGDEKCPRCAETDGAPMIAEEPEVQQLPCPHLPDGHEPCDPSCPGWGWFNSRQIQRCDSCDVFADDDEARAHVAECEDCTNLLAAWIAEESRAKRSTPQLAVLR